MLSIEYLSCINQSIGLFQKCLAAQNYWLHHQTNAKCGMILKYPPLKKKNVTPLIDCHSFCSALARRKWTPSSSFRRCMKSLVCLKMGCIPMANGKVQRFSCEFTTCFFPKLGHMLKGKKSIELRK